MTVPFVHSNYERIKDDDYKTIDSRCIIGFLQHFYPAGLCIDPCSPNGSGIVDTLTKLGYRATGIGDAFTKLDADWVITNPPYSRDIVDTIINEQIMRVNKGDIYGLAVLLRSNFDFAKSRTSMFSNKDYFGQIKLLFRPWWSEERKSQPIHNYVWHIWKLDAPKVPVILYANGVLDD